jgi:hypothetical protein
MKDEYYPQDFTVIDAGITTKDAVLKYPDSYFLMMNMRYNEDDDMSGNMLGDIFFVCDDEEELDKIEYRLKGFGGIGSYFGNNILAACLGLNSVR